MSDVIGDMRSIAAAAAEPYRARGMKLAWHEAGRALGISARRVRALLNGEPVRIGAAEYLAAKAAHQRLLREQEARLDHELTLLRARLSKLEGPHG